MSKQNSKKVVKPTVVGSVVTVPAVLSSDSKGYIQEKGFAGLKLVDNNGKILKNTKIDVLFKGHEVDVAGFDGITMKNLSYADLDAELNYVRFIKNYDENYTLRFNFNTHGGSNLELISIVLNHLVTGNDDAKVAMFPEEPEGLCIKIDIENVHKNLEKIETVIQFIEMYFQMDHIDEDGKVYKRQTDVETSKIVEEALKVVSALMADSKNGVATNE